MRKYDKKLQEVEVLTHIKCNNCGKTDKLLEKEEPVDMIRDMFVTSHYHNFNIVFNYGSKFDTEQWSFDLCEDCIEEITNNFKIPIDKNNRGLL